MVHAKGYGAYGTFRVTQDISKYTCAKIFSSGRQDDGDVRSVVGSMSERAMGMANDAKRP